MAKVIIIGKGPAGISAALYTKRANIDTLIIGKDTGALSKSDKIENYYGFSEPIKGTQLLKNGIQNASRLGCEIISDEVVGIIYDKKFLVQTKINKYESDAVILATGSARNTPDIPGIKEFEGKGISYCAICDAFFYRKKDIAVLGSGEYALHEAMTLLPAVSSVTMLTNGKEPETDIPSEIAVDKRKIDCFKGESTISEVCFTDGSEKPIAGIFIAEGIASSCDLAKKIGAQTEGTRIVVNSKMETNIPGLYGAGDCTGGLMQISKSVGDGAIAGTQIIKYLRKK